MLRQSQKMEAVGLLAGGVAHDFNNLLSVIIGYSGLLLAGSTLPELQRKKVEKIKQAGDSAASLTRQLLAFSRQQVLQPEVLELHHIVEKMEDMLRRLINEDIEFSTSIAPCLMPIFADAGQVEQILINLCVNASDAMPTGGSLQIEAVNVDLQEPFAAKAGAAHGRFVKLTVTDSGTGMDAETQAHIFEPFFTTKKAGKGTGLGLATVYGIVKQTGGLIEVDSNLGRGTSFHVYLPVSDRTTRKDAADIQPFESPWRATVLVVEDSEPLRDLILETLEASGHNALIAEDGPKAIKICAQYSGPIELLLSDVVMPKMNGPEVLKRVKELRPNISVIFMSGYTNDVTLRHGITTASLSFLQKPFTSTQLESAINEALSRPHEREPTRSRPNTDPRPTSSSTTRKA
jgi:CheY-like chemotaxis protein